MDSSNLEAAHRGGCCQLPQGTGGAGGHRRGRRFDMLHYVLSCVVMLCHRIVICVICMYIFIGLFIISTPPVGPASSAAGPRVACLVAFRFPDELMLAEAIAETWGPQCDVLTFFMARRGAIRVLELSGGFRVVNLADARGNHLSNTTLSNGGFLQKWRMNVQMMVILDTVKSAYIKRGRNRHVALDKQRHPRTPTRICRRTLWSAAPRATRSGTPPAAATRWRSPCTPSGDDSHSNNDIEDDYDNDNANNTYIYIYMYTQICVYIYIYVYIHISLYISLSLYIYIYLCIYIYIYIYTYLGGPPRTLSSAPMSSASSTRTPT